MNKKGGREEKRKIESHSFQSRVKASMTQALSPGHGETGYIKEFYSKIVPGNEEIKLRKNTDLTGCIEEGSHN